MSNPVRILVFDSGLGGLSVARAVRALAQDIGQDIVLSYAADTAGFPYGNWPEDHLRQRILALMDHLIDAARPDVVVIACNTATVTALSHLRATFDMPFVGTVPAIKPAAHATKSGIIGVLATPSTVKREYTEMLIHTYAFHHRVVLHGAANLARLAERLLAGDAVSHEEIAAEIAPAFVQDGRGRRTDVLVLGCTHYPLIRKEIEAAAPWPVTVIDPSEAIARRALEVAATCRADAEESSLDSSERTRGWVTDAQGKERLADTLAHEGFSPLSILALPDSEERKGPE